MKQEFIPGKDFDLYDIKLMEKMYNIRFSGIPLTFTLLDLRKTERHCHETADMLVFLIENSSRVTGNLPDIVGKDKSHSWVEDGEFCYDATEGVKWKKDVYYRLNKPTDIVIHPREESLEKMHLRTQKPDSPKELMVALMRDLEANVFKQLYRPFLRNYMQRFIKEKNLDVVDYDEQRVQYHLERIKKFYEEIKLYDEGGKEKLESEDLEKR